MKRTILFIFVALIGSLTIQSCCGNNDEDPIISQFNFTISNDEGNLFLPPNNFTLDSIKITTLSTSELVQYQFSETDAVFTFQLLQGIRVSDELSQYSYLIELPNADIDTLTFDQPFTKIKCGGFSSILDNVQYNGQDYGEGNTYDTQFDFIKD